jgi:hypothetical protein
MSQTVSSPFDKLRVRKLGSSFALILSPSKDEGGILKGGPE